MSGDDVPALTWRDHVGFLLLATGFGVLIGHSGLLAKPTGVGCATVALGMLCMWRGARHRARLLGQRLADAAQWSEVPKSHGDRIVLGSEEVNDLVRQLGGRRG